MKALDILKMLLSDHHLDDELYNDIEDAIAELETFMKPKTCDGCRYDRDDWLLQCNECTRKFEKDYYERKES